MQVSENPILFSLNQINELLVEVVARESGHEVCQIDLGPTGQVD